MSTLTIRKLDNEIKSALRIRAAAHGRSMEEEARQILKQAVQSPGQEKGLGARIHARFLAVGGVDLAAPTRSVYRSPPDFCDNEHS